MRTRTSGLVQKREPSAARTGKPAAPDRTSRRIGAEKSRTRLLLLDAAERLMLKEGYPAVTSRKVASEADVTSQLVHYYFPTMDDLFLALWRRFVTANMEKQAQVLASPDPLRALWEFTCNAAGTALEVEFMALARHRKAIRMELAHDGDRFRSMQIEVLARVLEEYGMESGEAFAEVVAMLLSGISRGLIMEEDLGSSVGHARTFAFIDRWLDGASAERTRRLANKR